MTAKLDDDLLLVEALDNGAGGADPEGEGVGCKNSIGGSESRLRSGSFGIPSSGDCSWSCRWRTSSSAVCSR
jgi:hypothetical protein